MATSWIFLLLGLSFTFTTVYGYVHLHARDHYHNRTRSKPFKNIQRGAGGGGLDGLLKGSEGRRHSRPKPPDKKRNVVNALSRRGFIPDTQKCCRVGKKVARRKLACSMNVHLSNSDSNSSYRSTNYHKRQYLGKLFPKIGRCAARFTSHFEKCCKMRQEYMQRVRKSCKSRKNYRKRKCREVVRRNLQ
ncbi:uncharacterized protein LOC115214126 [Octopus sinensis]|uniref:Uncharacterized protein LOC115214126 n=1 Tax=Octopus sinensis TaxID=2607531 RepID=A0A6P7SM18_9MOLL|nr:uncharacterized protein LOC115214126 [Octopus sinensis]